MWPHEQLIPIADLSFWRAAMNVAHNQKQTPAGLCRLSPLSVQIDLQHVSAAAAQQSMQNVPTIWE